MIAITFDVCTFASNKRIINYKHRLIMAETLISFGPWLIMCIGLAILRAIDK